jgi:phospholipid-binding lipoprotein MlaA
MRPGNMTVAPVSRGAYYHSPIFFRYCGMRPFLALATLLCLFQVPQVRAEDVPPSGREVDPFESFNRAVFVFNERLDQYFMKPVAKGYHYVTPDFIEQIIGNVFGNLYDANASLNSLLQWRLGEAATDGGRFLVNSTLGLAGMFDVASRMGMERYATDFGHTLAVWGVPTGPYLMVPLFGPRTVRSGTGSVVDIYGSPQTYIDNVRLRNSLFGLELVDTRARLLDAEELMSGDRYIFVRDVYLQQREALVNGGEVQDSFSDFGEDGAWEEEF